MAMTFLQEQGQGRRRALEEILADSFEKSHKKLGRSERSVKREALHVADVLV